MGLLLLSVVVALALTLVALATIAIVQLVLFVTVRNTVLVLVLYAVYTCIDSRRRRVAKGFYTCTELPEALAASTTAALSVDADQRVPSDATRDSFASAPTSQPTTEQMIDQCQTEEPVRRKPSRKRSLSSNDTVQLGRFFSDEYHESDASVDGGRKSMSSLSDSGSSTEEAQIDDIASAQRTDAVPPSGSRLPELRRKKWTTPSHNTPLKHKSEPQLLRRSASSAVSSPRRPELFGSPRSVAMEQRLMKSALESDGYWIGDFRLPQPALARRTRATGVSAPSTASPIDSTTLHDRTGPRAG